MTSSPSHRRTARPWRRFLGIALVVALCLGAVALLRMPRRAGPEVARDELARALLLLKASNATAANRAAQAAVRADPDWGLAHAVLARTALELEDGAGAEAELDRAAQTGFDPRRAHQLRAQALLLQGQPDRALAEAAKTAPRYAVYGLRMRGRALAALGKLPMAEAALVGAVRQAPNDVASWVDLGRFRYANGDVLGAGQAAARGVALDRTSFDALLLRAELVRTQYGLIGALPWFEAALTRDPWRHAALIEYAATLGDAGRSRDMLATTRRALAARPGSPQAYYLLAVLAARGGDMDLSRNMLQRGGDAIDDVPGVLLLGAVLDLDAGGDGQAIEKLKQLVARQPLNLTARKLLAVALLHSDAARDALDLLQPVVQRGDADSYALLLAARAFERVGDRGMAARLLDRAALPVRAESVSFSSDDSAAVLAGPASTAPADPAQAIPYIRALLDAGQRDVALERARALAQASPGVPAAQLVLGDLMIANGRLPDAVAAYKRAADLRFDEPTMLRLVDAQDRSGARPAAANTLALFLSQNPTDAAALRLSAHWQLASGDFDAAIDTLEGLRDRLGDGDAALNTDLAVAYANAGENQAAVDAGADAYALAPNNAAVADAYGWAVFRGGDARGGLELLQKALALAPRHAGVRWHLAQVLAAMHRLPEAKAQAQAALADPSFADRAAAQALVAQAS